jgi:ferredoxin-nitrite reductase
MYTLADQKLNKIEEIKAAKDPFDIAEEIPRFAREGWESIPEDDRERLKWRGVFFRKQTPGHFMMRLRMSGGKMCSAQLRVIAQISREFGPGYADITTRQQIQLRGFTIGRVEEIWRRLEAVGLHSRQTGMDNVRGVMGCPVAGLGPAELFDASPIVRQFTEMIVGDRAYTNLPRKFNVTITGCTENCTHGESQDISLTPAVKEIGGVKSKGFNVAAGGKMGSGGYTVATPLDLFVPPDEAARICSYITLLFRDNGSRANRHKNRLAFLIDEWGVEKFRRELEARSGRALPTAGEDARNPRAKTDHAGIYRQRQEGLNYVGLVVPVGRITSAQMEEVARLADSYGNGDIRLTPGQNLVIANVPDKKIGDLTQEPLLRELRYDPPEVVRGMVSCTGIDYCHFAAIETKGHALDLARYLEKNVGQTGPVTIHWSGCPNACGNHAAADIGLLGKKTRRGKETVDAVDVFVKGKTGPGAKVPLKLLENVPCDELPKVLAGVVPYITRK